MTKHDRVVIDLSLKILRAAMSKPESERIDTPEVRLALRCLLPHCPERWPLTNFWESAVTNHSIGRSQGATASFNGICRQLRRAGRYPDDTPHHITSYPYSAEAMRIMGNPVPPAPAGIDPREWEKADERVRKWLLRRARG